MVCAELRCGLSLSVIAQCNANRILQNYIIFSTNSICVYVFVSISKEQMCKWNNRNAHVSRSNFLYKFDEISFILWHTASVCVLKTKSNIKYRNRILKKNKKCKTRCCSMMLVQRTHSSAKARPLTHTHTETHSHSSICKQSASLKIWKCAQTIHWCGVCVPSAWLRTYVCECRLFRFCVYIHSLWIRLVGSMWIAHYFITEYVRCCTHNTHARCVQNRHRTQILHRIRQEFEYLNA